MVPFECHRHHSVCNKGVSCRRGVKFPPACQVFPLGSLLLPGFIPTRSVEENSQGAGAGQGLSASSSGRCGADLGQTGTNHRASAPSRGAEPRGCSGRVTAPSACRQLAMALITLALAFPVEQGSICVSLKDRSRRRARAGETRMRAVVGTGCEHGGLQYRLGLPVNLKIEENSSRYL